MKAIVIVFYLLYGGTWQRTEFPYATFSSIEVCQSFIGMAHPPKHVASIVVCEESRKR